MSKILVVAAHPDDELLGVGGTLARHVEEGDVVHTLILGQGMASRGIKDSELKEKLTTLREQALRAAKIVGIQQTIFENLPDNRFDAIDFLDIVKLVEKNIALIQPNVIYTHHYGDLNIDHRLTYQAVITATRPIEFFPKIYTFETLSATEWNFGKKDDVFCPNYFVNIEETINKKIKALECYQSEMRSFPHPRSLKGIEISAQRWGMVVGHQYVEAFELIRQIR